MAAVYTTSTGAIGFCLSRDSERRFPVPADATLIIRFDEATNSNLAHRLKHQTREFSVVVGQLFFQGIPVVPDPPGSAYQDWQNAARIDAMLTRLDSPAPITDPDLRTMLRRLCRLTRHLLRETRDPAIRD